MTNVLSLDEFKYYTDDGCYKNAVISNSSPASPLLYDALNDRLYIRVGYKSFIDPNDYEPSDKLIGMAVLYDLRSGEYTQTSKTVISKLIMRPNYKRYKGGTPRKRNDEMVDICDMVLSFWDGISKGTKHILIMQRKLGSK